MAIIILFLYVFLVFAIACACVCRRHLRNLRQRRSLHILQGLAPRGSIFNSTPATEVILRDHNESSGFDNTITEDTPVMKVFPEVRKETQGKEKCIICIESFKDDDMVKVMPCKH